MTWSSGLAPAQLYRKRGNRKNKNEEERNIYTSSFWGMIAIQSQCKAEMQTSETTSFKFNLSINVLVFDSF